MAYDVRQWPASVYPGEVNAECPEALAMIDTLILRLRVHGPSPIGYQIKTLGAKMGGLWQINLRVMRRQVRVLYAPYDRVVVIFRIHKKGSPQEQTRAYALAKRRKSEYDAGRVGNARGRISH
jgi:hypothetical protein